MKPAISLLLLVLFPFGVFADTLNGKVVKITDGDTLVVMDAENTQHKIRLSGIDALSLTSPLASGPRRPSAPWLPGNGWRWTGTSMIAMGASWARRSPRART